MTKFINPLSNFLQGITLRIFADWQVKGIQNVPPTGPLIVVSNHQSNFDPTLISTSFPRPVRFLAKKELFSNPLSSWFLRQYGASPVARGRGDLRAYRWSLDQLECGQVLVIFPEGTRSPKRMRKANPGVIHLALKSQAPLLPIGITGTEHLHSPTRVFIPTGKIRINIGSPFTIPPIDGRPSKKNLDSLTEMVMERIATLLPPDYRGVYHIDA